MDQGGHRDVSQSMSLQRARHGSVWLSDCTRNEHITNSISLFFFKVGMNDTLLMACGVSQIP